MEVKIEVNHEVMPCSSTCIFTGGRAPHFDHVVLAAYSEAGDFIGFVSEVAIKNWEDVSDDLISSCLQRQLADTAYFDMETCQQTGRPYSARSMQLLAWASEKISIPTFEEWTSAQQMAEKQWGLKEVPNA